MLAGKLIIPRRCAKRDLTDDAARGEVVAAWRKGIFNGLPAKGIAGCRLLKAYVTTVRGPRRTLYLIEDNSGNAIFLMHKPKGDPVGDNMSYANPDFRKAVDRAVRTATEDIEVGEFEIVEQ